MQVARNFFLSSEKTLTRKLYEALLAFKIEASLSKDQILELYMNQIYLGQRAYGFAAAAQIYFGKPLDRLTAGRGGDAGRAAQGAFELQPGRQPEAREAAPAVRAAPHARTRAISTTRSLPRRRRRRCGRAPRHRRIRRARRVRRRDGAAGPLRTLPGRRLYAAGSASTRRSRKRDQEAAYAVAAARRARVRPPARLSRPRGLRRAARKGAPTSRWRRCSQEFPDSDDLLAAVVLEASPKQVQGLPPRRRDRDDRGRRLALRGARRSTRRPRRTSASGAARSSACRRTRSTAGRSCSCPTSRRRSSRSIPQTGAVRALVGGFDFNRNKFNHVTQAWRQPGSSFKPFIYSAALEKGFTPATVVNDAPVVVDAALTGGQLLGAEELRRQVRRPDAPAHGAREVEEHGLDPRAAGDRHAVRAGLRHALRLRCRQAPALSHAWRSARVRSRRGRWRAPTPCSPTAATGSSPT